MREILFRGKRTHDGRWVYGYLFKTNDWVKFNKNRTMILETDCCDYPVMFNPCKIHNVIPETVGQYVGFADRNGVKIFEGDILDTSRWFVSYSGDLKAGLGMNAGWYIQRDNFESWSELDCESYHVVLGNIWDNPELLER